jgi:ferrous iron transport protein B
MADRDEFALERAGYDYVVALAGNPNTGKSTVFNGFTGLRQHTGNWPGKTVARAEGTLRFNGKKYKIIDLPGTYSLLSTAVDEEIARDFILFGRPDAVIVVVDATNVERNLNLVFQVLEITDRAVVCLNLMDEAERRGLVVDIPKLAEELGVPVIPCVARTRKGLPELASAVEGIAEGITETRPRRFHPNPVLEAALGKLVPEIESEYPGLPNARWIAMRLLDGDARIERAIDTGELKRWSKPLEHAK